MSVPLPRAEYRATPTGDGSATPRSALRHAALTALLGVVISGDFANFYITLSVVANEYPLITVLVVLALTAAAVALAHAVGQLLAQRHHRSRVATAMTLATLVGSWLFLGVAAAVVRWFAPPLDVASDQFGTDQFGGSGVGLDPHLVPRLTSLLLFALYVASGVLAAWIGYLTQDLEQQSARAAGRRVAWTNFRHRRARARLARAETGLQRRLDEDERLAARHAAELAQQAALAQECKEHARLLIATILGDPVATEGLTRTRPTSARSIL